MDNANQYTQLKKIDDSVVLVNYADEIIKDYRGTHKLIQSGGIKGVNFSTIYILKEKATEKLGIINNSGELLIPFEYDNYSSKSTYNNEPDFPPYIFRANKNGLYALGDIRKGIVTDAIYSTMNPIKNTTNLFEVEDKNGLTGVIDSTGKQLIPTIYDFIEDVSNDGNLFLMSLDRYDKDGVIDINNNIIIPFERKSLKLTNSNSYFMQSNNNRFDLINKDRTILTKKGYKNITIINDEFAEIVNSRKSHKFFDLKKNKEIAIKQSKNAPILDVFITDCLYLESSKQEGVIGITKYNVPYKMLISDYISGNEEFYDDIKLLENGAYKLMRYEKEPIGISYKYGDELIKGYAIENGYNQIQFSTKFSDKELFIIKKDNLYGIMNSKNEIIIPIKYKQINNFFKDTTIWHTFFITGSTVDIDIFKNYFILRDENDNMGLADNNGCILFEPIYKSISFFDNNNIKTLNNDEYGMINLENKQIIEPKYISIKKIQKKIFQCINHDSNMDIYTINGTFIGTFKGIDTTLLNEGYHRDNFIYDYFCVTDKNTNYLCLLKDEKLYKLNYLTEINDTIITFIKIDNEKYIGVNISTIFTEEEFKYCIDNNIFSENYKKVFTLI